MKAFIKKTIKISAISGLIIASVIFILIAYGIFFVNNHNDISSPELSHLYSFSNKSQSVFSNTETENGNENKNESNNLQLFGSIPVKQITADDKDRRYVSAGGELIGIKLKTKGVLVVGTEAVETDEGTKNPAKDADIRVGDTLISIEGKPILTNSELSEIIKTSEGKKLTAEIIRDGETITTELCPEKSNVSGLFKCGIWIRDSTGGIGTLSYTDPESGAIVSLGHGIYDVDTKELMKADSGYLVDAHLNGIIKGVTGTAGEIRGSLGFNNLGEIIENRENGLYSELISYDVSSELIPVAETSEIKTGHAQIISTVTSGEKQCYDIEIEKISKDKNCKNLIIKVTDEELLEITGGIIQGMSGSPIIQDGMFVGAVTHVFLNDPTRGYGICAEKMLETSDKLMDYSEEKAA